MTFSPAPGHYERMIYDRCGRSGLLLPAVSLGLWNNFGRDRPVHSAEKNFGRLLRDDLAPYRDELVSGRCATRA